jgi:hypothetical protein
MRMMGSCLTNGEGSGNQPGIPMFLKNFAFRPSAWTLPVLAPAGRHLPSGTGAPEIGKHGLVLTARTL